MPYEPKPIDTAHITLPDSILELGEMLAKNAHDVWGQKRISDGWRYGPTRDDATLRHPCLLPYEELPDSEKSYDREMVTEVLKVILALGYRIEKP